MMENLNLKNGNISNRKFYFLFFIIVLTQLFIVSTYFSPHKLNDSVRYTEMIRYYSWESGAKFYAIEANRPLCVFLPVIVHKIFKITPDISMIISNILYYYFTLVLLFKFISLFVMDKRAIFLACILYCFTPPVLETGFYSVLTDSGSHFLFILLVYLSYKMIDEKSFKNIISISILFSIALLYKQSIAIVIIWFAIEKIIKKDYKFVIIFFLLISMLFLSFQIYSKLVYNFNVFDLAKLVHKFDGYNTFKRLVTYILITFNLGWFLFFYGFKLTFTNKKLFRLFVISFLFILSWLYHPRFFIFLFPVFFTSCAYAISSINKTNLVNISIIIYQILNMGFYFMLRIYGYDFMRKLILEWKKFIM